MDQPQITPPNPLTLQMHEVAKQVHEVTKQLQESNKRLISIQNILIGVLIATWVVALFVIVVVSKLSEIR